MEMKEILQIGEICICTDIFEDFIFNLNGDLVNKKGIQLETKNGYIEIYNNGTWEYFKKEE